MNAQNTSAGTQPDLQLEIAHLLLIDVVGYSKLLVNEQIELLQELNRIVRNSECFRAAETSGKLTRVPTGDGMALLFFRSPEEPAQCALEISVALKGHPHIRYAWVSTADLSIESPTLMIKRTLQDQESMSPSG